MTTPDLRLIHQQTPLEVYARSWELSLRARNIAQSTIDIYLRAVAYLDAHLIQTGRTEPSKEAVQELLAARLECREPATVSVEFRALQQFFSWYAAEGEGPNVTAGLSAPRVAVKPVEVFTLDQMRQLVKSCEGNGFTDRRDMAMIRLFIDVGPRRGEVTGITTTDLDLREGVVLVTGKGDKQRWLPMSSKTIAALDRYLRARARHPYANETGLWLGIRSGPLKASGVRQVLRRRGEQAGIPNVYPHRFRHSFAHEWLLEEGTESDLMRLMGWSSQQMVRRYGASAADARAREAHKRKALGDRV
jgi:site-specific recombinase XerD